MPSPWSLTPQGVVLLIYVQPRASHNRLVGVQREALKVALTAPPVEGAANMALLAFLATLLHVPRSALSLLSGAKSREKRVLIHTVDSQSIVRQVEQHLARLDKNKHDD